MIEPWSLKDLFHPTYKPISKIKEGNEENRKKYLDKNNKLNILRY
jgi:hypothetical protein